MYVSKIIITLRINWHKLRFVIKHECSWHYLNMHAGIYEIKYSCIVPYDDLLDPPYFKFLSLCQLG